MHIVKIISFNNAWLNIRSNYQGEFDEILSALDEWLQIIIDQKFEGRPSTLALRDEWETILSNKNWMTYTDKSLIKLRRMMNLRGLGPIKCGLSVSMPLNMDFLTRWIFSLSTIAIRSGVIDLPILLTPTGSLYKKLGRSNLYRDYLEAYESQIDSLMPLTHPYPFLVVGFSDEPAELIVNEIHGDAELLNQRIVEKSIEFPAEYHVAGLGILNYFGTYLREQYPDENAKVKIEQDGLIVRLIVVSADGKSEIIEKALQEYQLIVSGQEVPEAIINNDKLVFELKQELGIAALRVESQKNLITMQNATINMQDRTIQDFRNFLELSLSRSQPIQIEVNPTITSSNILNLTFDLSQALQDIKNLKSSLPINHKLLKELADVEEAVEAIGKEADPSVIKHSNAMSKLGGFIKKFGEGNDKVEHAMVVSKKALETFQKLAGTYNGIAQWCGLPQVPKIFTK